MVSNSNSAESLVIQSAAPEDVPRLFELVRALAEYEKLAHEVTGTTADLHNHLFGDRPYAEALIAKVEGNTVGFALFFHNFSTFLMKPGIYLEDLFVLPAYRRQGIAKALLTQLAQLALERGCGRLEWSVLDWNTPAIDFYQRLGAEIKPEWQCCRVTGAALENLGHRGHKER
ncbi:MAG: GNAT family N-acetyltransferase [Leptolyngbyaceae cyanobacterium SM1_1_3]|nr:GNAT family N-acetyltransferase [Leptolyngbyaceae cyanobacterium SM1_1_3]NJN04505.1 GNAT family N-acetyltransferase [Leptolyngbyaceae cyanobacterium RM1_1_2]NJO11235.1 GNAT family N-acetyltransferase [Leptolyngbyaceae cyanobacterium SL_1_1]